MFLDPVFCWSVPNMDDEAESIGFKAYQSTWQVRLPQKDQRRGGSPLEVHLISNESCRRNLIFVIDILLPGSEGKYFVQAMQCVAGQREVVPVVGLFNSVWMSGTVLKMDRTIIRSIRISVWPEEEMFRGWRQRFQAFPRKLIDITRYPAPRDFSTMEDEVMNQCAEGTGFSSSNDEKNDDRNVPEDQIEVDPQCSSNEVELEERDYATGHHSARKDDQLEEVDFDCSSNEEDMNEQDNETRMVDDDDINSISLALLVQVFREILFVLIVVYLLLWPIVRFNHLVPSEMQRAFDLTNVVLLLLVHLLLRWEGSDPSETKTSTSQFKASKKKSTDTELNEVPLN